jgi:NTP pyrophosphatase (non-canonical NTP hydrolase)
MILPIDITKAHLDVVAERIQQDKKWGEQYHSPADWLMILGEEVGEANKAALEARFGHEDLRKYREELVQVAAVAIAMIECFDHNYINPNP